MMPTTITVSNTSTGVTVSSGTTLEVLNGGTVVNTTVLAGGTLLIDAGGTDSGATIQAGGTANVSGTASGDTISGTELVSGANAFVSNETVVGGGTLELLSPGASGTNLNVLDNSFLIISGNAIGSNVTLTNAVLDLESPKATLSGTLTLSGANNIYIGTAPAAGSAVHIQAVISGFSGSDIIDDTGIVYGSTVSLTSAASGANTTVNVVSGGTTVETFTFAGNNVSNLSLVNDGSGDTEIVACYCPGTMILTDDGEVAIEALSVGDVVKTVGGALEPIQWIGRRSYTGRVLAGRRHLLPVCIKAGALSDGVPSRDLMVSPMHAMLIDGLLVPAYALLNGHSVTQAHDTSEVHYVHIELRRHDAIFADGAPSETFVDDAGRYMFQSSDGQPVSDQGHEAIYYAPRIEDGFELEAIRTRMAERARLQSAA